MRMMGFINKYGAVNNYKGFQAIDEDMVVVSTNERLSEYVFKNFEGQPDLANAVNCLAGSFSIVAQNFQSAEIYLIRDHVGVAPLYYSVQGGVLFYASEVKDLLLLLKDVEVDPDSLHDYLHFQTCLNEKTMFKNIYSVPAGSIVSVDLKSGKTSTLRYWDNNYHTDYYHNEKFFVERYVDLVSSAVNESVARSDNPSGCYISGGMDSSTIAYFLKNPSREKIIGIHGHFTEGLSEIDHARSVAKALNIELRELRITSQDFLDNIEDVIYAIDYPVAGVGAFSQYMAAEFAAAMGMKTMYAGSGGDELFGGYARYIIAYFEQCVKAAIEGKLNDGSYVVTYESIIPNLETLQQYIPMLKRFWSKGLFDSMDERYFALVNRGGDMGDIINWEAFESCEPALVKFGKVFNSKAGQKRSYFDMMSGFDYNTLMPGLIQVEDRVNMAHGITQVAPLLHKDVVSLSSTIPADIKFKGGQTKYVMRRAMEGKLPDEIVHRKSKMGFPTPLGIWAQNELKSFFMDLFGSLKARSREYYNAEKVRERLEGGFLNDRQLWGLMSLELWFRKFIDK